jgi:hypothetical protein
MGWDGMHLNDIESIHWLFLTFHSLIYDLFTIFPLLKFFFSFGVSFFFFLLSFVNLIHVYHLPNTDYSLLSTGTKAKKKKRKKEKKKRRKELR